MDLALLSVEVTRECSRCGVLWSLENPYSSKLFGFPPVSARMELLVARLVTWCACAFFHNLLDLAAANPGLAAAKTGLEVS